MPDEQLIDETPVNLKSPNSDGQAAARASRLMNLGIMEGPDPEFDEIAAKLAFGAQRLTGAERPPFTMVNFRMSTRQYFTGLYVPEEARGEHQQLTRVQVGREMPLDWGGCPHVVQRRLALPLDDICDFPRFAGNPVVDHVGIRSYNGAPIIDRTGTLLGTVCIVDTEPRRWGQPGLQLIKATAAELVAHLEAREQS